MTVPNETDQAAQRTALYRFYDASDRLLYVGITKNPKARSGDHSRDKALTWWPEVDRHTLEWFDSRPEAADAEVKAIEGEAPMYNLSRTPSPMLVSASGARHLGAQEVHEEEWLNVSQIARRLVAEGIEKSMSRQRVMQLAERDPAWPVPRSEWRFLAHMWLFPWAPVADYFRNRDNRKAPATDSSR